MSSNDQDDTGDNENDDGGWYNFWTLVVVLGIAQIVYSVGISTIIENLVQVLVIVAVVISIITVIGLRYETVPKWLFAVTVMKLYSFILQKVGSWERNWRVRNKNPEAQTPTENLADALQMMMRRLADAGLWIVSSVNAGVGSAIATYRSIQNDEQSAQTTDDNKKVDE